MRDRGEDVVLWSFSLERVLRLQTWQAGSHVRAGSFRGWAALCIWLYTTAFACEICADGLVPIRANVAVTCIEGYLGCSFLGVALHAMYLKYACQYDDRANVV